MSVAEPIIQTGLLGEAIDHGPVAVFVADDDMCFVAVNQFAADLLGYSREELLALCVADVVAGGDAKRQFADMIVNRAQNGHQIFRHRDGNEIEVEYRASETHVSSLSFYVVVVWPV